jgi:hypothetical protein
MRAKKLIDFERVEILQMDEMLNLLYADEDKNLTSESLAFIIWDKYKRRGEIEVSSYDGEMAKQR